MQTPVAKEMPLTFVFRRKSDGRYSVKSDGVPGLFLASNDLAALWRDLDVSIRDLLYWNSDLLVADINWKPTRAAAFAAVEAMGPARLSGDITETCIVTLKAAA